MPVSGGWANGHLYDGLLAEFLESGGDLSRCPFETPDYKWQGPPHTEVASDCDPVLEEEETRRFRNND